MTSRLRVEALARYLHAHSGMGRFVGYEGLSAGAQEYYRSEARQIAGVLVGDVASAVVGYEVRAVRSTEESRTIRCASCQIDVRSPAPATCSWPKAHEIPR